MTVSAVRLAEVFVELADPPEDTVDLSAYLRLVTLRVAEVMQSDAAGMLLADRTGQLRFVAGSDEATTMLELFQLQHEEGPCLDCFKSGEPVVNTNLAQAADRWPRFAPMALGADVQAVHAIPLRRPNDDAVVGAMSLVHNDARELEPDDVQIAASLGSLTAIRLIQDRTIQGEQDLVHQLQFALTSRIAIEQAKGAVAQVLGVSVDRAFELMRAHARRNHLRVSELAQTLVADPARIAVLAPDPEVG